MQKFNKTLRIYYWKLDLNWAYVGNICAKFNLLLLKTAKAIVTSAASFRFISFNEQMMNSPCLLVEGSNTCTEKMLNLFTCADDTNQTERSFYY